VLLPLGVVAHRLGSADNLPGDKYPVAEFAPTSALEGANWVRRLNSARYGRPESEPVSLVLLREVPGGFSWSLARTWQTRLFSALWKASMRPLFEYQELHLAEPPYRWRREIVDVDQGCIGSFLKDKRKR